MNVHDVSLSLIINPPNYHRVLFGFPRWREERLRRYKLYKIQQHILNPEDIPNKKKASLYRFSLHHLELWIQDAFVNNFDQQAFESLSFAWSRARQDDIPFLDACNVHFNVAAIPIAPIGSHAILSEISHIGISAYDNKNLPELREKHSRDKFKKIFLDDLHLLLHWLSALQSRLQALMFNHTVATESLIKYIRTQLYKWHLSPTLRQVEVRRHFFFLDEYLDGSFSFIFTLENSLVLCTQHIHIYTL